MTEPFAAELKNAANENRFFRKVLFTGANSQLVLMSIEPGEEIGSEVPHVDQVLYAVEGDGEAVLGGAKVPFEKGGVICVPAGVMHNIINTGDEPLKLFTVYAPPEHEPGTIHETRAEAEEAEKALAVVGATGA